MAQGADRVHATAAPPKTPHDRINVPVSPTAGAPGTFGILKQPADSYTGTAFLGLLDGKGWLGWDADRKCLLPQQCKSGKKARMRVQAIGDANDVSSINQVPGAGGGIVVGRIVNVGKFADKTTGVHGNQAHPDEIYIIIHPDATASAGMEFAIVTFDQVTGLPDDDVTLVPTSKRYMQCANHPHRHRTYAQGDFVDCDMPAPPDNLTGLVEAHTSGGSRLPPPGSNEDAFAWFSCLEGCCSAQIPPAIFGARKPLVQTRRVPALQRSSRKSAV